jgi:hypothetical protein
VTYRQGEHDGARCLPGRRVLVESVVMRSLTGVYFALHECCMSLRTTQGRINLISGEGRLRNARLK